jgi:hypothetical protein
MSSDLATPATPATVHRTTSEERRARREVVSNALLDGCRVPAVLARVLEAGFDACPRTVATDVAVIQRQWSLEGGRRMQRRREVAVARLASLIAKASRAGDLHAARSLLALETRILGMWQPAPVLAIDARTVHVSTPLPSLYARLGEVLLAQGGEQPSSQPPIETTLVVAESNGSAPTTNGHVVDVERKAGAA